LLSRNLPFKCVLLFSFLSYGCASTYKPMTLPTLVYMDSQTVSDSLRVSYRFGVQEVSGNRRYANKEKTHGLAAVAVKVQNLSTVPLSLSRTTFKVSSAAGEKVALSPLSYSSKIKQRVGLHMLHALWGPWGISWSEDEYGERDVSGFYIPVGAIVGIGNAVRASNANKKNLANMEMHEIWNKTIAPGETIYGLIAIPARTEEALNFEYGKNIIQQQLPLTNEPYVAKYNVKSSVFDFYVTMLDGTSYDVTSKIYVTASKHYVLKKEGGATLMVNPSETRTIARITASGKQLLGIPEGDQWLFKVIEGRINGYFFLAEDEVKAVSKIQKENGGIVDFSPQALLQMVEGDPDAAELIAAGKYVEAIRRFNSKP
jgi:hypothetical protein